MSVERIGVLTASALFLTRSRIAALASAGDLLDLISESVSSSAPYFPNSRHNEVIAAVRALFSSKAR